MEAGRKEELLNLFDQARNLGVKQQALVHLLGLERHRLSRWRLRREGGVLEDRFPGPRQAPHRLLSEEREAFLKLARCEELADAAVPVLCAYGSDRDIVQVSPSTGYRILKEAHWSEPRGTARKRKSFPRIDHGLAVAPNCLWCWDITPLYTYVSRLFYFLYVLLDEYSRYVLAWRLEESVQAAIAREMFWEAIDAQHVLDLAEEVRPRVLSDRGSTMKSRLLAQTLEPLHMLPCFTRPSTPTDNPFIESFFSTLKGHPTYPGRFETLDQAQAYCMSFFSWYNHRHLHSSIGYVTPADKHYQRAAEILEQRTKRALWARQNRFKQNRLKSPKPIWDT